MAETAADRVTREDGLNRRDFLRAGSLGCAALAVGAPGWAEAALRSRPGRARSVILLWMEGGPSPQETFAPQSPGAAGSGPFGSIPSRAEGIRVGELMPRMAGWMDRVTLFRAISHREGSHAGACHQMLTGRAPASEGVHLTLGEVITQRLGTSGRLTTAPAVPVSSDLALAPHLALPEPAHAYRQNAPVLAREDLRADRRHALLAHLHTPTRQRTPTPSHTLYGASAFGRGCLAARQQVEAGAPFVSVPLSGWDAHADLAGTYRELVPQFDQAFAALLVDLQDRGLLEETLVLWMGEFGRSPRINALGGRDHWPYAGCAVLAGGGLPGGQVIGEVDEEGYPSAGAVTPAELLGQVYARLGETRGPEGLKV